MRKEQQIKVTKLLTLAEEAIKNGSATNFNTEASLKQAELYMQLAIITKEM